MMYLNEKQKVQDMKNVFSPNERSFRMATVKLISAGRPIIRFHGEKEDSLKKYKYLVTYIPTLGDIVLLAKISGTYVILGKVV